MLASLSQPSQLPDDSDPDDDALMELVEVPYPREERDMVDAVSGQRRVPVLVDGDAVVIDSRRIVRHLYATYGGASFARSIDELDHDIAMDGEEGDACAFPGSTGNGRQSSPAGSRS